MELAFSMYNLHEYLSKEGKNDLKWIHSKNKEEFVKKFQEKLENANDEVVENFTRIYLQLTPEDSFFHKKVNDEWILDKLDRFLFLKQLFSCHLHPLECSHYSLSKTITE